MKDNAANHNPGRIHTKILLFIFSGFIFIEITLSTKSYHLAEVKSKLIATGRWGGSRNNNGYLFVFVV